MTHNHISLNQEEPDKGKMIKNGSDISVSSFPPSAAVMEALQ